MAKVIETGAKMAAQSRMNQQRGPSRKNLGPSADKKANPAPMIRSMAGKNLKGPDMGAGGS